MAGALGSLGLEASRGLSTGKEKDETIKPPEGEVGDVTYTVSGDVDSLIDITTQSPASMQFNELIKDPDLSLSRSAASKAYALDPIGYQANINKMVKDPSFGITTEGEFVNKGSYINPFYGYDLKSSNNAPFGRSGLSYDFLNNPQKF